MEAVPNKLCSGCLSSGRKMKSVNDFWSFQAFMQVWYQIPMITTDTCSSLLCWECEARITNFVAFRDQVNKCSKTLQKYIQKDSQPTPKTVSKLDVHKLPIVDAISDTQLSSSSETHIFTLFNNNNKTVHKVHIKDEQDELKINEYAENIKKLNINDENGKVSNINDENEKVLNINDENGKDLRLQVKNETEYSDDDRSLIDVRNDTKARKDLMNSRKKVKRKNGNVKLKNRIKLYEEIELTREEVLKERQMMEQREEYVNSMFRCEKCIIPFPNEDDLKDHQLNKHELHGCKHSCDVCSRTFGSAGSLSAHVRRHTSRRRCLLCAHTTTTDRAARSHYTGRHEDSEMYDLATKVYQSYGVKSQDVEMDGNKSASQFPCEFCEKTFRWKTSLRKHMETHRIEAGHKRKPYCDTCRLSFTTTSNLRKHVKTSSKHQIKLKLRKLKEDLPGSPSDPEQQAKDIETIKCKINSQREQFPCPQCEKKFQWKGNLLRHLQSHAAKANGELVCEPCNRTFSSIATYKQHMKISRKHVSENEFKYMCSDCGKRFSNKIKLRDHIDWEHLKNYTHKCQVCQKVFKSHTSLYLHRQVVHKHYNSEHLCDHCGKSFPNKTKLRSHIIALHTQESPYKCDTCPARFGWHSCLSRHMRRVHRNVHRSTALNT